jgi:PKD repeat protein
MKARHTSRKRIADRVAATSARGLRIALLAVGALGALSCDDAPTAPASALEIAASISAQEEEIRIVNFGDSNTDNGTVGLDRSVVVRSYVSIAPEALAPDAPNSPLQLSGKIERVWAELRGTPLRAVNHGITGTTTGGGGFGGGSRYGDAPNARTPVNGVTRYEAEVLGVGAPNWHGGEPTSASFPTGPRTRVNAYVPDGRSFAYVSIGTNDLRKGITNAQTAANLAWMIERWTAAGQDPRRFIITTLPPVPASWDRAADVPILNASIRGLAAQTGAALIDLSQYVSADGGLTWRDPSLYVGDGVHYSEPVREWLAREVVARIEEVFPAVVSPDAPTASFTATPQSGQTEGGSVVFDGSTSSDPAGGPLTYSWTFGDGTSAEGRVVTHPYIDDGEFSTMLVVTNAAGLSSRAQKLVTIDNTAPVVNAGPDLQRAVGVKFYYWPTFTDAGLGDGPWQYTVDWGDGTTYSSSTTIQGEFKRFSVTRMTAGTFTIRITVRDKNGAVGTDEMSLSVMGNVAPVANANGPYSGPEGGTITLTSVGTTDANGDALTYKWDFGDGTSLVGSRYSTATKKYNDNGSYPVTLTVTDAAGLVGTATTSATITNVPPTATLSAPSKTYEGSGYTVAMTGGSDVGLTDKATLEYAIDCGLGEGYGAWTSSVLSIACPVQPDQRDPITVRGKVRDKDGGETAYSRSMSVSNVAPIIAFAAASPTTFAAGGTFAVTVSFSDPGFNEGPYPYQMTWGDGLRTSGTATEQGTIELPPHSYPVPGVYSAYMRVYDKDGVRTTTASITVTVTATP